MTLTEYWPFHFEKGALQVLSSMFGEFGVNSSSCSPLQATGSSSVTIQMNTPAAARRIVGFMASRFTTLATSSGQNNSGRAPSSVLMINDEWWMMNDEWRMINDEWWMMNDKWQIINSLKMLFYHRHEYW